MTQILNLDTHAEPHASVPELAAYWHVTERTVYLWIEKQALPSIRVGRTLRVKTVDAIKFGRPNDPVVAPVASVR